jgi:hypothetical protein
MLLQAAALGLLALSDANVAVATGAAALLGSVPRSSTRRSSHDL